MGSTFTLKDKIWLDVLDLATDPADGRTPPKLPAEHSFGCLAGVGGTQIRDRVVWSAQNHIGAHPITREQYTQVMDKLED